MRILFIFISTLLFSFAALSMQASAQGWTNYVNARYGASADVPPGFAPAGPEAHNSDGMIFRTGDGGLLTIYGADVPGSDFEIFMAKMMENETSYNGWPVAGSKVTPGWAEYWGGIGASQLRVKVLVSCSGRQAVVTRFQFTGNRTREADRVANSLQAVSANSC